MLPSAPATSTQSPHDHFLDTSGLVCPLPVLKARKIILSLKTDETLLIQMTDPDAPDDLKALCRKLHAEVLSLTEIKENETAWQMLVKRQVPIK